MGSRVVTSIRELSAREEMQIPPMRESHGTCCLLSETTALVMAEQPLLRDNSRDGCVLSCPVLLVLH